MIEKTGISNLNNADLMQKFEKSNSEKDIDINFSTENLEKAIKIQSKPEKDIDISLFPEKIEETPNIKISGGGIIGAPEIKGRNNDKKIIEAAEKELKLREEYGKKEEDLTKEEKRAYELRGIAGLLGGFKTEEIAPGVVQKDDGKYITTERELYDGKTFDELSEEDQIKIELWQQECEEIEERNRYSMNIKGFELPECPLEKTTEIRIKEKEQD